MMCALRKRRREERVREGGREQGGSEWGMERERDRGERTPASGVLKSGWQQNMLRAFSI
jgi:hypothetical protein